MTKLKQSGSWNNFITDISTLDLSRTIPFFFDGDKYKAKLAELDFSGISFASEFCTTSGNVWSALNSKLNPVVECIADVTNNQFSSLKNLQELTEINHTHKRLNTFFISDDAVGISILNALRSKLVDFSYSVVVIKKNCIDDLVWYYLKLLSTFDVSRSVTILPRQASKLKSNSRHHLIISGNHASTEELSNVPFENNRMLFFSGHGNEDVLTLNRGSIVGTNVELDNYELNYRDSVSLREIKPIFLFLNSCLGEREAFSHIPNEATLTGSFFSNLGMNSIGSVGVKYGPDAELCYLRANVLNGTPLAECVKITNQFIDSIKTDTGYFEAYGLANVNISLKQVPVNIGQLQVCKYKTFGEKNLSFMSSVTKQKFYYLIAPGDPLTKRSLRYFYWNELNLRPNDIQFISCGKIDLTQSLQVLFSGLNSQLISHTFEPGRLKILRILKEMSKVEMQSNYDSSSCSKYAGLKDHLHAELCDLSFRIMSDITKKAGTNTFVWLPDNYLEQTKVISKDQIQKPCSVCGFRLEKIKLATPLHTETRLVEYCPGCGLKSDRADEQINAHIGDIYIADNSIRFSLKVHSSICQAISYIGITVDSSVNFLEKSYVQKLDNENEMVLNVSLNLKRPIPYELLNVKIFILSNLKLYHFNQMFYQGDGGNE